MRRKPWHRAPPSTGNDKAPKMLAASILTKSFIVDELNIVVPTHLFFFPLKFNTIRFGHAVRDIHYLHPPTNNNNNKSAGFRESIYVPIVPIAAAAQHTIALLLQIAHIFH